MKTSLLATHLWLSLSLSLISSVGAGIVSWDGNSTGTGTSMTIKENWAGDVIPVSGDDVIIANTSNSTQPVGGGNLSISANRTFGNFIFGGNSTADTNLPATLYIVTNGSNSTNRTLTINSGITMTEFATGNVTFPGTTNGTLTLDLGTTGTRAFHVANATGSLSFVSAQVITGGAGINKTGLGILGTGPNNTFAGGAILTEGTWRTQGSSNAINSLIAFGPFGTGTLTLTGGTLRSASSSVRTYHNNVSLGGSITLGDLTFNGTQTFSAAGSGATTLTANTTLSVISPTVWDQPISGNFALTKAGAGNLTLSALNPFTGGLTISNGTVSTSAAGYLGSSAALNADAVVINGGKLLFTGTGNKTASVSNRGFKVGSSIGTIEISDSTRVWEIGGQVQDVTGQAGKLVKTGAGELILSNASNTFTGGLVISQGVLTVASTAGLGSNAANDSAVTINGGTLRYTNNTTTVSDGTRGFRVGASGGSIDLVSVAKSLTIAATIQNVSGESGTLTKLGLGKLILSGNNTYTGTTTVTAGTLLNNGTIAGSVSVASGASVGGKGIIQGTLSVNQGGSVALELRQTDYDSLDCKSTVSLNGSMTVTLAAGYDPAGGDAFDLLNSSGTPSFGASFSLNLPELAVGKSWDQSSFNTTGIIRVLQTASAFDLWATSYSLTGNNASLTADPDHDGITNQDEFAFGSNPNLVSPALVSIEQSANGVIVTYVARDSGVTYTVKSSSDLQSWVNATGISTISQVSQLGVLTGYTRKQFSATTGNKGFFRIEASIP